MKHSSENEEPTLWSANVVDRITADDKRFCWSERGADINIHCSDGFILNRKGHQIWPSLWNGFLLFRENQQLMLYRFEK